MIELVTFVARSLVDHPDEVEVREIPPGPDQPAAVLELRVAPGDLGKVIGRGGRTARALRTLLSAASARSRKRVMLDIVE